MTAEESIKYPVRSMRLSDEVWESLKVAQKQSGKSWNIFIKELNGDENISNFKRDRS
jgi:predicted DNA-binding protein